MLYSNEVTRLLRLHPFAVVGIILTALVNLFYFFLIFVGIIFIIVFIKKAIGVRKTMMLGQKGTKRCAALNYGAIIFYVFSVLMFVFYYSIVYFATILSPLLGTI